MWAARLKLEDLLFLEQWIPPNYTRMHIVCGAVRARVGFSCSLQKAV